MSCTYSIMSLLPVRSARSTCVRDIRRYVKTGHVPGLGEQHRGFRVGFHKHFGGTPSNNAWRGIEDRKPLIRGYSTRQASEREQPPRSDREQEPDQDGPHELGNVAESHLLSSLDAAMAANTTSSDSRSSRLASRQPTKPPPSLTKDKQTVVVTGGSGAIGLAIAQAFAKQNHPIILCGRNETKLKEHRAMLGGPKDQHDVLVGDITSKEFIDEQLPAMIAARLNHINEQGDRSTLVSRMPAILVNCAGITQYTGLATTKDTDIEEILATNLLATIRISKFFVKQFLKNKQHYKKLAYGTTKLLRPNIINISSLLATHGGTGATVYAASKAGILGFTRALAGELSGKGIRVNAILPGYIESEMTGKFSDKYKQGLEKSIPVGRFGSPREVAGAAVFLAYNQYCNGCEIRVDGGLGAVIAVGDA